MNGILVVSGQGRESRSTTFDFIETAWEKVNRLRSGHSCGGSIIRKIKNE